MQAAETSTSRRNSISKPIYAQQNSTQLKKSPSAKGSSQSAQDSYSSGTFEMGKYKTKLCRHWKTGYCLFGPSCVFAHGVDDLCEPNLLNAQMNNLVLVPVQAIPMPVYPNDSSSNPSQLSYGWMPVNAVGGNNPGLTGLAPPTFAYQGMQGMAPAASNGSTPAASSALAFGFTPELLPTNNGYSLGGVSYYNQGRNDYVEGPVSKMPLGAPGSRSTFAGNNSVFSKQRPSSASNAMRMKPVEISAE